jgi:Xaa-Pro aminopeptidase
VRLNEFTVDAPALKKLVRGNLARLNTLMERDRVAALLAITYDNWRYLTGLPVHHSLSYANVDAAIFRRGDELPSLLPLDFFANGIRPTTPWYTIRKELPFLGTPEAYQPTGTGKWPSLMAEALGELGLAEATIALDPGMPWVMQQRLQSLMPSAKFLDGSSILVEARMIKTPEEIDAIRRACRIADLAIEGALAKAREGVSESELAGICEALFRQNGAEYASMMPNVFSGDHPRLGYISSSDRTVRSGELVRFDIGCVIDGYCCCIARTGFVGPADPQVSEAYDLLHETLEAGIRAVRPGGTNVAIHTAMSETLKAKSKGRYGLDSYGGHGIGLGLHEEPMIGSSSAVTEIVLQPGMVFAIEPSFRIAGKGWLGLEDNVAVTEIGVDLLNHAKFALRY